LSEGDPAKPKYDLAWTHNHLHGKPQPEIPTSGFKVVDVEPAAHVPLLSILDKIIDPEPTEKALEENRHDVSLKSSLEPSEKALEENTLAVPLECVSFMSANSECTDVSGMRGLEKLFGDCGARNLLVSLGLRFDLTVVVNRAGVLTLQR
jgi:hypothetical protein